MAGILIKNGIIADANGERREDILIEDGRIKGVGRNLNDSEAEVSIDAGGKWILPGLVDVHVHLREPGFSYKETIHSGTKAAAKGGFTTVCPMPNLNPVPDTLENLERQLEIIRRDAVVETIPYASITRGRMGKELVDYALLSPLVAGFSDDGSGVQDEETMRKAMAGIARTGKILAAHCEVEELLNGGYIHDGLYASAKGHKGICSESEWREVERNIRLSRETGCRLHICHVSTRESVELIRKAKREGLPVTCETGAHYLVFTDEDLQEDGRFKMNPPLRGAVDRRALLEGIADGTIDCIASDHAPHSDEEKSRGLEKSAMGVTGIELSLPAVYSHCVKTGLISLQRMIRLMAENPRRIFGIEGGLEVGARADLAIVDFNEKFTVGRSTLVSKGKSTPFEGEELYGVVHTTVHEGKIVYQK